MYINPTWDFVLDKLVPPKLKSSYTKFKCILDSSNTKIYKASPKSPQHKNTQSTIRVLDVKYTDNQTSNALKTSFAQEMLYQCLKLGQSNQIMIQKFQMHKLKMASVSKGSQNQMQFKEIVEMENSADLLIQLIENIKYLNITIRLSKLSLETKNLFFFTEINKLIICNWVRGATFPDQPALIKEHAFLIDPVTKTEIKFLLTPEVYLLALKFLQGFGSSSEDTDNLLNASSPESYHKYAQEEFAKLEVSCRNETLKAILKTVLFENRIAKAKFERVRRGTHLYKQSHSDAALSVAWTTNHGTFSVYNMSSGETYELYQRFSETAHKMKFLQIPNEKSVLCVEQLISERSAFRILDNTKDMHNVYRSDYYKADTQKHIPYSKRTNYAGLFSVSGETLYHLLDLTSFQMLKRAKWKPFCESSQNMDMNTEGQHIATYGNRKCYIFNLFSDEVCADYNFQTREKSYFEYCRWNPEIALLAITFSDRRLNFIDTSKGELLYKSDIAYDEHSAIWSLDWRNDGNLILAVTSNYLAAHDLRQPNQINIFAGDNFIQRKLNPVGDRLFDAQWSPCGNYIACNSSRDSVFLIDFRTRAILCIGNAMQGGINSISFLYS